MKYGTLTLGQIEALVNIVGGMEAVERILAKTVKVMLEAVKRLTKIGTVALPDAPEFVLDEAKLKEANIGYLWDDFRAHFFNQKCPAAKAATYARHRLEQDSLDKPIMDELGSKAQTSLAHFIWLISQQGKGQEGDLLTNGYANIFYIKDGKGVVWAVDCLWYSGIGYWVVNANSVERRGEWYAGHQVFSQGS